ncbi:site-specific integrase [bacterium AH-315-G11]|nr:site-specific integrase [bacterium AH-315-G11]
MATIQHRGTYQWRAQVRRKGYPVQSKTFETKADSEAWARSVESEMDHGIFRPTAEAERTTLHDLLTKYAKEVTTTKKGRIQELSKINVIKSFPISQYAIAKINGKVLSKYRDDRLKSVSPKTVRDDLSLIGHVLKVAIQDWSINLPHGNPIDLVRKPKVGNNSRSRRLNNNEEKVLIATCEEYGGAITNIVLLALETGMRRGELASLQWKDIDISQKTAHLPNTKNGESRDVPLSSTAIKILQSITKTNSNVFTIHTDSITTAFSRICKRACSHVFERNQGIKVDCKCEGIKNLRFHDLRHEATSRFFELGLNPMQVASITGHKTLQMLKRYTHLKATDIAKMLG